MVVDAAIDRGIAVGAEPGSIRSATSEGTNALLADGAFTVRVKCWVAFEPTPLLAVMVSGYEPAALAAAVPDRVAVPSPLSRKLTPLGRAPLSERAAAGREIWINACDSCHLGPGRIFSGNQSRQAFAVLSAIARGDPALFRKYVRDPKSVISTAKMEPHPHYSDAQLDSIIAFVEAEQR